MRTTIDIPNGLHERLKEYAAQGGLSLSSAAVEMMARGMTSVDVHTAVKVDPHTSLLTFNFQRGRPVTAAEVADLVDEDA